jgi:hypothetical protein
MIRRRTSFQNQASGLALSESIIPEKVSVTKGYRMETTGHQKPDPNAYTSSDLLERIYADQLQ